MKWLVTLQIIYDDLGFHIENLSKIIISCSWKSLRISRCVLISVIPSLRLTWVTVCSFADYVINVGQSKFWIYRLLSWPTSDSSGKTYPIDTIIDFEKSSFQIVDINSPSEPSFIRDTYHFGIKLFYVYKSVPLLLLYAIPNSMVQVLGCPIQPSKNYWSELGNVHDCLGSLLLFALP